MVKKNRYFLRVFVIENPFRVIVTSVGCHDQKIEKLQKRQKLQKFKNHFHFLKFLENCLGTYSVSLMHSVEFLNRKFVVLHRNDAHRAVVIHPSRGDEVNDG